MYMVLGKSPGLPNHAVVADLLMMPADTYSCGAKGDISSYRTIEF